MFEKLQPVQSYRSLRKAAPAGLLLLALMLCAGGLSPAVRVLAAAPPQPVTSTEYRFHLKVVLPDKLCAGQKYSIQVTPMAERTVNFFGKPEADDNFVYVAVPIKAEISNKSIATINPANNTYTVLSQGAPPNLVPSPATFYLQAKKAGTTFLYLTATVPTVYSGKGNNISFGPGGMPNGFPIKIQNCDYDVTVIYWWVLANDFITWWTSGVLKTRITATDPEYYGGDGSLDFLLSLYDIACSQMNTLDIPTHISAHYDLDKNKLAITFTSQDTGDAVTTCPNTALMSPVGVTAPSGPWAGSPVLFPPEGGTKIILLGGGGGVPPAKVTITLKPVVATGTK